MDDTYVMVASPSLLEGRPPKRPADLSRYPLLRADRAAWDLWCTATGTTLAFPERGVEYEDMGVMLQSAIDGAGVMLARRSIAALEIERGTLRALFDVAVPADAAYWVVWPEDRTPSDRVLAFREWIHAEAARPATVAPVARAGGTRKRRR